MRLCAHLPPMNIYIGLLVLCVVGLVVFFASKTNADAKEVGRLTFFAALLALCFEAAPHFLR
jgi:hypothetical protein